MQLKALAGIVLLLIIGYGGLKAWPLVSGPSITLDIPNDYTTFADGVVPISGRAKNTENLSLNGGPLLIDPQGRFSTSLLLPEGGAILTFIATDRFGSSITTRRTVYVPITSTHGIQEESSEEGTTGSSTDSGE